MSFILDILTYRWEEGEIVNNEIAVTFSTLIFHFIYLVKEFEKQSFWGPYIFGHFSMYISSVSIHFYGENMFGLVDNLQGVPKNAS